IIIHGALLLVPDWRSQFLVLMFLWFAFNVTMATIGKKPRQSSTSPHPYEHPTVAVVVATRNGDAMALRAMLDSLDRQQPLFQSGHANP
ncbi:hypothetical protein, partial [Streptomyces brasiliscabiei]|uniref:hypothetical protein n=1 Tax=Streptomyces brasiliscabiei TaxID=2736302 RepID=UPI0030147C69